MQFHHRTSLLSNRIDGEEGSSDLLGDSSCLAILHISAADLVEDLRLACIHMAQHTDDGTSEIVLRLLLQIRLHLLHSPRLCRFLRLPRPPLRLGELVPVRVVLAPTATVFRRILLVLPLVCVLVVLPVVLDIGKLLRKLLGLQSRLLLLPLLPLPLFLQRPLLLLALLLELENLVLGELLGLVVSCFVSFLLLVVALVVDSRRNHTLLFKRLAEGFVLSLLLLLLLRQELSFSSQLLLLLLLPLLLQSLPLLLRSFHLLLQAQSLFLLFLPFLLHLPNPLFFLTEKPLHLLQSSELRVLGLAVSVPLSFLLLVLGGFSRLLLSLSLFLSSSGSRRCSGGSFLCLLLGFLGRCAFLDRLPLSLRMVLQRLQHLGVQHAVVSFRHPQTQRGVVGEHQRLPLLLVEPQQLPRAEHARRVDTLELHRLDGRRASPELLVKNFCSNGRKRNLEPLRHVLGVGDDLSVAEASVRHLQDHQVVGLGMLVARLDQTDHNPFERPARLLHRILQQLLLLEGQARKLQLGSASFPLLLGLLLLRLFLLALLLAGLGRLLFLDLHFFVLVLLIFFLILHAQGSETCYNLGFSL
mmetsp:Transcript_43126/g.136264  ORF Transcript_43126/g.136264 Transcript_43126/m.136264 type:complete len:583 (-) Transcript_43126:869-2617(-)